MKLLEFDTLEFKSSKLTPTKLTDSLLSKEKVLERITDLCSKNEALVWHPQLCQLTPDKTRKNQKAPWTRRLELDNGKNIKKIEQGSNHVTSNLASSVQTALLWFLP